MVSTWPLTSIDSITHQSIFTSAIEALPQMAHDFMQQVKKMTGWSLTMACGGPDPRQNGDITTISIHSCTNINKQSYARATPNFQQTILKPFSEYLHILFRTCLKIMSVK